jgi:hypothetical protein
MVFERSFITAALAFLEANPDVAAVGGDVREMNTDNAEFEIRARALAADRNRRAGIVEWLDGGGLYRTQALREVGWFADRNLHAFEEFELGARMKSQGLQVARIDRHAVDHYGHQMQSYALLLKRLRSGSTGASGEVLRAALGQPHLGIVVRRLPQIRYALIVTLWWLSLLAAALFGAGLTFAALLVAPYMFLSLRRRSLRLGLFSFVSWNLATLAFFGGLRGKRRPPSTLLASRDLTPPASAPMGAGRSAR